MICFEASVAVKWFLPEDFSEQANELFIRSRRGADTLVAPAHWPVEISSAILKRAIVDELTTNQARAAFDTLDRIEWLSAYDGALAMRALEIARQFSWRYPYDAFYLAVGERYSCDVWTADRGLFEAGTTVGVSTRWLADYRG